LPTARPVMLNPELIDPFAGGVSEAGLKEQVAPDGQFVTDSDTALLYPAVDATVVVELTALPSVIVAEDGLLEIEKFGAAVIVNETVVV
jgi:hypothetical protein